MDDLRVTPRIGDMRKARRIQPRIPRPDDNPKPVRQPEPEKPIPPQIGVGD